ncbi:MAG: gliding motility-associated C-terminal domain-containing protein [Saprospiraceae bacterium]|nr:gliding motility-associated C-terminal domain-containing protein [Saprospiraceae bacterium]
MKQLFSFLFLVFGITGTLQATHIVGGELTYKCLGNNRYEFTLTVYRDCYTGQPWFDDPASIGVYDANWNLVKDERVYWDSNSNDTLPIQLSNPCLVVPPDVCAHGTVYKAIIELPQKTGGYNVVYQRCCRNQLIRNIIGPLETGITILSYVSEEALKACNNSAAFNEWPPVAICVHEPILFDHSATDPDNDSLVYRLCTPLKGATSIVPTPQPPNPGPYLEVDWLTPPYNLSNVLGGLPLSIDANTGVLTGTPNTIGNFVVGVCVEEYRNDTLVSTTRRDFQYNVAECGVPTAAFFVPEKNCANQPVTFVNQSFALSYVWYFDWDNDPSLISTAFSPSHLYADTGSYRVALITTPGAPCADTMFQTIQVNSFHIDAQLQVNLPSCDNNGLAVLALDQSQDSVYGVGSWLWTLTGPGAFIKQSTQQNPEFVITKPGSYKVRLIAVSNGGCRDTANYQFNAPIPRTDSLRQLLSICAGDTVRLNSGAVPFYNYLWTPPAFLSDTLASSPLAYPSVTSEYFVTITNAFCTYTGKVRVEVVDTGQVAVSADPTLIYPGQLVQLNAVFPLPGTISWSPPGLVSNPAIDNPTSNPTTTTTYTARLNLGSHCVIERGVTVIVSPPPCEEPFLFFPTGFSPNGDGENDILRLENGFLEEAYWAIYNRWGQKVFEANSPADAWDGTFKGEPQPAETYGYILRFVCPGGGETIKKGNVTLLR